MNRDFITRSAFVMMCALAAGLAVAEWQDPGVIAAQGGAKREAAAGEKAERGTDRKQPAGKLRQYLDEKDAKAREKLKDGLLKLDAPALRKAIAELSFPAAEGESPLEIACQCPDGSTRPYYVRVPDRYDPAKSYPAVVVLHGGLRGAPPEWGLDAIGYWAEELTPYWAAGVFLIGPVADAPRTGEGSWWYKVSGMYNVEAMIRDAKGRYNIDDNAAFVSGMSDGGSGTFALANRRPDTFAGFFPFVGHLYIPIMVGTNLWYENYKGARIYAIGGGRDDLYPASQVQKWIDDANTAGASIEYKIYPEAGHDVSYKDKELPGILSNKVAKWRRDLLPSDIDWSTESADTGRHAWISVGAIADLGSANADIKPNPKRDDTWRPMLGVGFDPNQRDSLVVINVMADSVAQAMGLVKGDQIIKIDGKSLAGFMGFQSALLVKKPESDIEIIVRREGKDVTLKGRFGKAKALDPQARVMAKREPGKIDIKAFNAAHINVWVAQEMLKDGKVEITVNGKCAYSDSPAVDAKLILGEFERTLDRTLPFIARVDIDVTKLLGAKPVAAK